LLPDGVDVPFSKINEALSTELVARGRVRDRALTATVVATGQVDRLQEAAEALRELADDGAVRAILIGDGSGPAAAVRVAGNTVAVTGVKSPFINNAVAALRLSSLPTLVWWRGGPAEMLDDLATLADRLVLDDVDPRDAWTRALGLLERTAFSDVHWTRLTRWRTLMAHFFDVPEVRAAARGFTSLTISGSDSVAAWLFARWLTVSLDLVDRMQVEIRSTQGPPIRRIRFGDGEQGLTLRLASNGTCVHTAAVVKGQRRTSRIVSLGDQSLGALLREELRIRSRDSAFERTIRAVLNAS
jgi:glucose-6-phosphate dehydrogenase assembly protein OpcA